ncbi:hypothetical protein, partial [uncultured Gammaproteobacteria bacterium]
MSSGGAIPAPNLTNTTGANQIAVVGFTITDITFGNSAGAIVSCTVAPTLPAGLSIDSATCTISGTPTKMRALNIYTVTAKDAKDNTGSASFSLTVNVLAPNLANATDQVATIGSAITNITFNNSGGAIASCTAAPTLPAGLSINSTTCTISGTPTEVRARTVYTVTAKNATDNTDSASFSLTVNAPAPNLTNTTGADQIATTDSAITDITFSNSGGAIVSCTVAPTLPAGLSIDSATCTISGTPTEVRARTVYTVTAKNATDNTDSAVFSLTVNAPAPNLTNATGADQIAIIGFAITNITFSNSGGAIASCTVAPTLPAGLSIDNATCTISGVPTEVRALSVYTVTAKNATDDDSANFSLTVNALAPNLANATGADQIAIIGFAITDITFSNSGNAIASCTVAPTLPAGLSIDSTTCAISGTPTEVRASTLYTVTAKDTKDNTDSASFSLTVNAPAPNIANAAGQVVIIGSAIANITFINSGGTIASCTVAPTLPAGLSIDSTTCTISGTPTKVKTTTLYTVTARNATDDDDAIFSLRVTPATDNSGLNRFTEVDFSSANNDSDGYYNASNYPNYNAFATIQADGSIAAWGDSGYGGTGVPSGSSYTKIYSNRYAFAALKTDGSIKVWGDPNKGGTHAPFGADYTKVYSTMYAFAALKANGSIAVWGDPNAGGSGAPSENVYTKIYSNEGAFAALKADGSITSWGSGSANAPSDSGYTDIYSTAYAFAALKVDGSITAWGNSGYGGTGVPAGNGYTKIYSNGGAFAVIEANGSITAWGNSGYGGINTPSDSGYIKIYSNEYAFAALKADGSITAWGDSDTGGIGALPGSGYTKIYSTASAFATIKADGSIKAWGASYAGGTGAPAGNDYTKIYSTASAFAALKADGSIKVWGDPNAGGSGAPSGSGYTKIYSTAFAFAARKADGSITAWGSSSIGGTTPAPNLANTAGADQIAFIGSTITNITFSNSGGAIASCTVAPTLPAGLSIDSATCTISGTPTEVRATTLYTVTAKSAANNSDSASFSLEVKAIPSNLANAAEHIAIIGFAITDITFSNSGGAIASCTVAPTLPAGLSINSTTCTISGTPTEIKALSVYTVTAKNAIDDTDSAS